MTEWHTTSVYRYLALSRHVRSTTTHVGRELTGNIRVFFSEQFAGVCMSCLRLLDLQGVVGTAPPFWTLEHGYRSGKLRRRNQNLTHRWALRMLFWTRQPRPLALRSKNATVMLLTNPTLRLAYAAPSDPPRMP